MIGSEAGEVMTAVQTAMLAGLPSQQLRDAVIAHLKWQKVSVRSCPASRLSPAMARKKGRWIFGRSALDRPAFRAAISS
jgi:hypothetical protein